MLSGGILHKFLAPEGQNLCNSTEIRRKNGCKLFDLHKFFAPRGRNLCNSAGIKPARWQDEWGFYINSRRRRGEIYVILRGLAGAMAGRSGILHKFYAP
jgi:hypothetical protein